MDYKQLLFDLYNAPSADDLYEIVVKYGLDSSEYWKPYGGNINNAGTFENQQSSPENALVEKLTNSVDAILMKECLVRGINPKSKTSDVPMSVNDAINRFFGVVNGKWENVPSARRNEIAQNIQIVLTEDKKRPNIAVYDNGEGQNPSNFHNTFLSIAHGNKNDVPFVQGKYNFGATGAVVFCGNTHRYQMIISRRNSELSDSDGHIGFTLVRRHILTKEEEPNYKLTWYEYLVIDGEIPYIDEEELDLGLNQVKFKSGSIVKMYSYQLTKPSMATIDLWKELNPLLFETALPILIYEARDYKQHSPTKVMLGNRTRFALDANDKIEFTKSLQISLFNSNIPIQVYIFNRDTKNTDFILGKSVIYTLNGQTQGTEGKTFISQELGFRNLREYMLISVDCSQIGTTARQELFMASRDRLKQGEYYNELKATLIDILKHDQHIRDKDQEYKGKAFKETGEDKELIESVFSHLKNNKDIRKMFSGANGAFSFFNHKVARPDNTSSKKADKKEKREEKHKKLRRYPSFLKVKGFDKADEDYIKVIRKGGKGSIVLKTDVENEFLSRSDDAGSIEVTTLDYRNTGGNNGGFHLPSEDSTKLRMQISGPYDGELRIIVEPREEVEVGQSIPLSIKMISSAGEHEVIAFVKIDKEAEPTQESKQKTVEEPEMALPELIRVVKESTDPKDATWASKGMNADSIVKIDIGAELAIETIYINMDSNLVKKLINAKGVNIERIRNKYVTLIYSHVLMMYTTICGYYTNPDLDISDNVLNEIKDTLNSAVEFSFQYYANFLMTFDDYSD